jgi:succinyl-CoA synthetase alpha subunit
LSKVSNIVKKNFHRDSVQLLHLSEEAKKIEGIKDAAVVMGTTTNKEILQKLNLLTDEGRAALESDMILAVMADSQPAIDEAMKQIEEMVLKPPAAKGRSFYSVNAALQAIPDANLAIVSIPGEHAREVVLKLLDKGLNVHLFSDHVPAEHELELKQHARERGLLVMGPGAGSSIIRGKAFAFANVVKKGKIGVVAAAGTGLQEVTVLLSEAGLGVSEALGTGGGDVKSKIGGITTLQSLDALEQDPATSTVLVVSKPPDADVKRIILDHIANKTKKQYVTCFVGPESYAVPATVRGRVKATKTLHAAVVEAIRAAEPNRHTEITKRFSIPQSELSALASKISKGLSEKQRYVRGLYTGGTFAYEALVILGRMIGDVYSNAPIDPRMKLADSYKSNKDSIVDLGEEEFTVGRAHPMIDPTIRRMRLVEEAKDPEVAVIMMDFMLGYGSHSDPAGAMLSAISEAKKIAEKDGRVLPILAHVCGTEQDPQPLSEQIAKLRNAGVEVFPTNALMAIASALISRKRKISSSIMEDVYGTFLTGF